MTFVLGGFCQALNRSLRAGLRPFFLPPGALSVPNPAAATSTAPKVKVDKSTPTPRIKMAAPPQTPLKRVYDVAGTFATQIVLVSFAPSSPSPPFIR